MAIEYYPFDAGAGATSYEASWSKMARQWLPTGVLDRAPFALAAGPLQCFGDSSGMQVKVHPGAAAIHGHYYQSDAEQTFPITAADPTNARIDRVVLRLDAAGNTMGVAVVAGTPAASPSPPALTQVEGGVWEIPLATVHLEAAETNVDAGDVLDRRTRARSADGAPRGRLGKWPRGSTFGPTAAATATDIITGEVYIPHDPVGRIIRVTLVVRGYSGSVTGNQFVFRLGRNTTVLDDSEITQQILASGTHNGFTLVAEDVDPPEGTHIYKAQVFRAAGAGTITITDDNGGATLYVDDVVGVV